MPSTVRVAPEELARIERFIASFNTLDNWLQSQPDAPPTFRSAVDWWARRHPYWRDADDLRLFASLRNFLVHEKTRAFDYPCVPSESATRHIEAIRDRLLQPATIGAVFGREVVVLEPDETLETALKIMKSRDIAHFPIYEKGHFLGMFGERNIAQTLSEVVARGETLSPQTPIGSMLHQERKRQTFRFAPPDIPVAQAAYWFGENTFLEVILISQQPGQKPTGIVTRGDIAGWVD